MIAAVLAIFSAFSFAFTGIFSRRAVVRVVDATIGVLISVPISVPFFFLVLLVTGQIDSIAGFSWPGYLWLSAAGILHFNVGRSLFFYCSQMVGVNITGIITGISPIFSLIIGVTVLGEPLTAALVVGVLLIILGVVLASVNLQTFYDGRRVFSGVPRKVIYAGLAAGFAWGISPVLVKVGLGSTGSPVAGAFISYAAATFVLSFSLWNRSRRTAVVGMESGAIIMFGLAGLLGSIAHLLRYIALSIGAVSVLNALFFIAPIFHVFLAFLINRKLEVFNKAVIIGTIAVVVGTILVV